MSQQALRAASADAVTGVSGGTYQESLLRLFDKMDLPAGTFNERMAVYAALRGGGSPGNINGALASLAAWFGASNFQSLGTITSPMAIAAPASTYTLTGNSATLTKAP